MSVWKRFRVNSVLILPALSYSLKRVVHHFLNSYPRQRSEIRGRRSEIGDQRSEIGGQRSEISAGFGILHLSVYKSGSLSGSGSKKCQPLSIQNERCPGFLYISLLTPHSSLKKGGYELTKCCSSKARQESSQAIYNNHNQALK